MLEWLGLHTHSAETVNQAGRHEIDQQDFSGNRRPWGFYEVISDNPDHKLKRITVYPDQRLSLQRHFRRSEHWYVIKGQAKVVLDGREIPLASGQAVDIPVKSWHRIQNTGAADMVFVEVQTGEYFGEDDIERGEDDYGRAK
ncbi:MAG: phosphomannose isomerase type II C-terminal cupin domain [Candidatus Wallbacteria bacterium]|nr:phosphomannose isomerase type II C-terminal cupin domain [Candidatus Wallbacteria bacterium]